jgi:predicted ATPase/class 3 adenylate cyclase
VLFSDVVGSTAMAEQLDPEEWAEIMNEAFDYLTEPVQRYEGTVARLMGDAILAFFGAPTAHEDDPQRAILAALDIVQEIQPFREELRQDYGLDFNVRVGINTGSVVVGDVGSDLAGEYTAMGDAVNLASRMEQTATAGTIQIAQDTYSLVAPLFDFEPLGGIEVKGKSEPIQAYRVLGKKADPGRLRGIEGLNAPMVGRGRELDTLKSLLVGVTQGRGGVVSLIGEAGLGKSRLLDETEKEWEQLGGTPSSWIVSRGVSYDTERPYGQFHQHLRRLYDLDESDPPDVVRAKVAASPESVHDDMQPVVVRAVDALLSIYSDSDEPQLEGEALKNRLFADMTEIWKRVASDHKMVMVFDDLHWADPASAELLIHMLQIAEEVPILFVCAFRPERQSPAWKVRQAAEADYPHLYTEIALQPLTHEDSNALVDSLLTISNLPEEVYDMIVSKTDGNPFFLEEVVRTLIDSGAVVRDETGMNWRQATKIEDITIPDTLQTLLISRFDRLEEEVRQTLQLASVIGRSFYYQVLKEVADKAATLDRHLNLLQRAELITEAARLPELEYAFRHELTREAAYNSILRRRLRQFHRQVGETIEALYPEYLEEQAHRLAYHFSNGGEDERAVKYYVMAGDAAARLYANLEAISQYSRALEIVKKHANTAAELVDLYLKLGDRLRLNGQFEEFINLLTELEGHAREEGDRSVEVRAMIPQATVYSTYTKIFEPDKGREISQRSLEIARELDDSESEARSLWNLLLVETYGGLNPLLAVEHGGQAIKIARQHGFREVLAYALNDIARSYFALARQDEGHAALNEARELWREMNNIPMLTDNLQSASSAYYEAAKFDQATADADQCIELSQSIGNQWGEAAGLFVLSGVQVERGQIEASLAGNRRAMVLADAANFAAHGLLVRSIIAWTLAFLGDTDRGIQTAQEAQSLSTDVFVAGTFAEGVEAYLQLLNGNVVRSRELVKLAYGDWESDEPAFSETYMGMFKVFMLTIQIEIAVASGDSERAVRFADFAIDTMVKRGMLIFLPDMWRLKAVALTDLGRFDEAGDAFARAKQEAENQGSTRALSLVLGSYSQFEAKHGDSAKAQELRRQGWETVRSIADQIDDPKLREKYLATPSAQAVTS